VGEGAEELPTIENMMAKLLLVEKRTSLREGNEEEKAYIGFNKTTRPRYGNLDRPGNKRHGGSDSKSSFGKMRENRTCYACGRKGHLQKDCWQRKAEAPGNKTFNRQKVALMADEAAMDSKDYDDEQDWVIDPGATMHIAAYPNLLINATPPYATFRTLMALGTENDMVKTSSTSRQPFCKATWTRTSTSVSHPATLKARTAWCAT
jgi:hypothetical protein